MIEFVRKCDVPQLKMKDDTYDSVVCNVQNKKTEKNRTRFVVGCYHINYPGEVATTTAKMLGAKPLFNGAIPTKGIQFKAVNIASVYLMTPLSRPEDIRVKLGDIPEEIIKE